MLHTISYLVFLCAFPCFCYLLPSAAIFPTWGKYLKTNVPGTGLHFSLLQWSCLNTQRGSFASCLTQSSLTEIGADPLLFSTVFQEMLVQLVQQAQLVNHCFSIEAVCLLSGIVSCLGDIASWVVSCVLLCVIIKGAHLSVMFESPRKLCNKYVTFRSVMINFKRYWKMNLSVQTKSKSKQLLTGLACSLFVLCAAHSKREC